MIIKAVITDMDGLLIDSEPIGWLAWNEALTLVGCPISYEEFLTTIGRGRREFLKLLATKFGKNFPVEKAVELRVEIGDRIMAESGMPKKPGVEQLFTLIRELEIPFGLATSTYRNEAEKRLRAADIPLSQFDSMVCGDDVANTKPAPDVYIEAARLIGIKPGEIIALEDSETGAKAAIAAGMNVIVIPDFLALPIELGDKVYATVSTLSDALEILRREFKRVT